MRAQTHATSCFWTILSVVMPLSSVLLNLDKAAILSTVPCSSLPFIFISTDCQYHTGTPRLSAKESEILRANPQDCLWVDGGQGPKKLSETEGSSFGVRKVKKE